MSQSGKVDATRADVPKRRHIASALVSSLRFPSPAVPLPRSVVLDYAGSLALFAIACTMLAFYLVVTYGSLLHSDSAMKLLLAEEISRQLTLFPRDWNYINDIPIIFPSILAVPLSWFFAPSPAVHAFVDLVAAGLVLFSAYAASRSIGIRGPLCWLPPILLASAFSREFAEMVFGQSAYSSVVFTQLLLAGWGAQYLGAEADEESLGPSRKGMTGIVILLVVSVAAGPRGLATYAAPYMLAAIGIYFLSPKESNASRRARGLVFGITAASSLGVLIYLFLLSRVRLSAGAMGNAFANTTQISSHLQLLAANWFTLFDALPPSGQRFSIVLSATYAARFGVALLFLFLPLLLLLRFGSIRSPGLRFLVLVHASVTASTLYLLVFTGLLVDEVVGVPRYLIPLMPTALLIVTIWLGEIADTCAFSATRMGWVIAVAMLTLSPMQLVAPAFSEWPDIRHGLRLNRHAQLLAVLQKADLHRGFADYWNANVISVLSGGDVRIAPVSIADGTMPTPFHHLSSERWFAPEWAPGPTFLVVDRTDSRKLNRPALDAQLGPPTSTLSTDGFDVLIYPFSLGERLGFSPQPLVIMPKFTPATCAADFVALDDHLELSPHAFGAMRVRAVNRSTSPWSQNSTPGFNPGLRIFDISGKRPIESRASVQHIVKPGETAILTLPFRAPAAGNYMLFFSFVAEGNAWCGDVTSNWVKVPLLVKP
ncbi:MAG: hypothetical protein ABIQ70_04665 [Dokdonella sp.]